MAEAVESVGFIGLGAMGAPIARRLSDAGVDLVVHDNRRSATSEFADRGVPVCDSPFAVAERCETVLVSLPGPDVVQAVVAGPSGLIEGGAIRTLIDLSTTGGVVARLVTGILAERGVAHLDAPVSGGVAGAEKGSLAVFVSGGEEVYERSRHILEVIGGNIVRVGAEPGQGQIAKLLNNLLSASAQVLTAEALALGVRDGLDPGSLLEALNAGTGRNSATLTKYPEQVLSRRFASGFRLRLMLKDVRLCLDEARAQELSMPVASAVEQIWLLAAATLDDDADQTEVAKLIEGLSGTRFGAKS